MSYFQVLADTIDFWIGRVAVPYEYLEDAAFADAAFKAWAPTVEELFSCAAEAMMELMVNLKTLEDRQEFNIELEDESLEMLLFHFLEELIFYKDAEQLLLMPQCVAVFTASMPMRAVVRVSGERIDRGRHELKVDVKAVTLHRFHVGQSERGWECSVVVDV